MKGDKQVVEQLNRILTNELTAVNQYFLHSRIYDNWGLKRLAKHEYEELIEEMKHADKIVQRVLLLEGLPNLQDLHKLKIGETVPEALAADLDLERRSRKNLIEAIGLCEKTPDYVSRDLVRHILDDTEQHIDYLETQLELVEKTGLPNYLQTQTIES